MTENAPAAPWPTPQGLYKKCTFSAEGLDLDGSGDQGDQVPGGFRGVRGGSGRSPAQKCEGF